MLTALLNMLGKVCSALSMAPRGIGCTELFYLFFRALPGKYSFLFFGTFSLTALPETGDVLGYKTADVLAVEKNVL